MALVSRGRTPSGASNAREVSRPSTSWTGLRLCSVSETLAGSPSRACDTVIWVGLTMDPLAKLAAMRATFSTSSARAWDHSTFAGASTPGGSAEHPNLWPTQCAR